MRAFSMHHAVKCQGAASYHAFSQQRRLPVLSDLFVVEGCDTSGNLVRSGRNQLEIIGNQLEITDIWLEIRNQDPVEIRKSARNHKKSSRNNEKHPLFV